MESGCYVLLWLALACSTTYANVLGVPDFGQIGGVDYTTPAGRPKVERKRAASMTQEEFGRLHEGDNGVPVVLTGAIDHWPSWEGPDKWTKEYLVDTAGLEELNITVQQGDRVGSFRQPLEDVLTHLEHSKHEKSFYTLTEVHLVAGCPPAADGHSCMTRQDFLYEVPELHNSTGKATLLAHGDEVRRHSLRA